MCIRDRYTEACKQYLQLLRTDQQGTSDSADELTETIGQCAVAALNKALVGGRYKCGRLGFSFSGEEAVHEVHRDSPGTDKWQLWIPLTPLSSNPLTVLDPATCEERDVHTSSVLTQDPEHQWMCFPELRPFEVLAFRAGVWHSAYRIPGQQGNRVAVAFLCDLE
eukprot:TRINITY_DN20957_c0_g1_i1.p1 TRINITY_DN20957_c0_g1~~TRINITY_DN20957_c0_g1_i1.p1  ORF type:complete len:165 (+),score=42.05 TRINITY_DN20957_c0_g1_i1:61-555(+)